MQKGAGGCILFGGILLYLCTLEVQAPLLGHELDATTEDKVKFTTPKVKGTFVTREDGIWKYTADEDSGAVPVNFLGTVYSGV